MRRPGFLPFICFSRLAGYFLPAHIMPRTYRAAPVPDREKLLSDSYYTPGRYSEKSASRAFLYPYTINPASRRNSPSMVRLHDSRQTTMPCHCQPALCTVSVMTGSSLQSGKLTGNLKRGAPGRTMHQQSASQRAAQRMKLRCSRLSPSISGYIFATPVFWYVIRGEACLPDRAKAPLLYNSQALPRRLWQRAPLARLSLPAREEEEGIACNVPLVFTFCST